jgi:hypothetical protein
MACFCGFRFLGPVSIGGGLGQPDYFRTEIYKEPYPEKRVLRQLPDLPEKKSGLSYLYRRVMDFVDFMGIDHQL